MSWEKVLQNYCRVNKPAHRIAARRFSDGVGRSRWVSFCNRNLQVVVSHGSDPQIRSSLGFDSVGTCVVSLTSIVLDDLWTIEEL